MKCRNCGNELPYVGGFCPFCGARVELDSPQPVQQVRDERRQQRSLDPQTIEEKPKKKQNGTIIFAVIVSVIAVIAGVFCFRNNDVNVVNSEEIAQLNCKSYIDIISYSFGANSISCEMLDAETIKVSSNVDMSTLSISDTHNWDIRLEKNSHSNWFIITPSKSCGYGEYALSLINNNMDFGIKLCRYAVSEELKYDFDDGRQSLSVGDTIFFGAIEQNETYDNYGQELIQWRVLEKNEDKILVVSEYAFLGKDNVETGTWSESPIRNLLSDEIFDLAFTEAEKNRVLTTKLETVVDGIKQYSKDKLFLLSDLEAEKYFKSDVDRILGSNYVAGERVKSGFSGIGEPWLLHTMSGNKNKNSVCYVGADGRIQGKESYGGLRNGLIRPAMWISIK